jgi:chemotaxis signal transduction protein
MATLSPLRARRLANRQTEPTEKLVVFPVQRDWFGLHLHQILRIEPFGNATAIAQEIQLIDLNQFLYTNGAAELSNQPSYLILLQADAHQHPFGLLLHAKPTLKRFPQSQFASQQPEEDLEAVFHKHCTMKVQDQSGFQVFLLDPTKIHRAV